MAVRFGRFVFDDLTRALLRDDAVVPLAPKPFQLLELLLEKRPRAVSKAEIHERLWPGTFVSDSSLTRLAAELRAALGDPARSSSFRCGISRCRSTRRSGFRSSAATPRS